MREALCRCLIPPPAGSCSCRFYIGARYYHDLAVTDGSLLNVFTAGSGLDLNVHTQAGEWALGMAPRWVWLDSALPSTALPPKLTLTTYQHVPIPADSCS